MRVLRAAALAAVCTVAPACSGGDDTTPMPGPSNTGVPAAPSAPLTVTITSQNGAQSFSPNPADAGGEMVVFHNADAVVHRVVLNDGTIDTGNIAPNATSAPILMPDNGTNYHCSLHPDMVGAVNTASGGGPPPCTGYC